MRRHSSTGCSPSRSGMRAASRCCSPATGSARSRCSTRCGTGSSPSPARCRRCSPTPRSPGSVDPAAIDEYLSLGYVPAPRTAIRGVSKLPPAHTLLRSSAGQLRLEPLLAARLRRRSSRWRAAGALRRAARRDPAATRKRMVADVGVGAFLSGGIDSSAVVAAMAAESAAPVRTFSIGFDDDRFDELPHARRSPSGSGTIHEEFLVRADAVAVLPGSSATTASRSPIPRRFRPTTWRALTRRHVTVALTGDGGDEIVRRLQPLRGQCTRRPAGAAAGRPAPGDRRGADPGSATGGDVAGARNKLRRAEPALAARGEADRYRAYMSWLGRGQRAGLYTPSFAAAAADPAGDPIAAAFAAASGADVVDRMLEVDVDTYLVGDLIAKVDIATMAHGLEARSPFLDPGLMQFAAALPAAMKVRGREKKWILREALRGERCRTTCSTGRSRDSRCRCRGGSAANCAGWHARRCWQATPAAFPTCARTPSRVCWSATSRGRRTTPRCSGACSCSSFGSGRWSRRHGREAIGVAA